MRILSLICSLLIAALGVTPVQIGASEIHSTSELSGWEGLAFKIEDTKCRVGIASVKLSVSQLTPKNGNLVGEYTIEVPLMQSKNDKGRIVLPLNDTTIGELGENGGVLKGKAISYKDGTTPNHIRCEVLPLKNKSILLAITTHDRTLEFKSNYAISEASKESDS